MTTKEKEIFTTEEAAEMMGCSPSTIEEHARNSQELATSGSKVKLRLPAQSLQSGAHHSQLCGSLSSTSFCRT